MRLLHSEVDLPAVNGNGNSQPLLASDLDVVTVLAADALADEAKLNWRVTAICADWRNGVESQIVGSLDPDLNLVGLTAAILHGKSVLLALCHRPSGPVAAETKFARPGTRNPDLPVIYFDSWQARSELGLVPPFPLLRVHLRVPDRSGATLAMLESLHAAIAETSPGIFGSHEWNVWYAKAVVTDGRVAEIQLTIMLPDDDRTDDLPQVRCWGSYEFARIERRTLELVSHNAAIALEAAGLAATGQETSWDMVIRLGLIKVPEWSPPDQRGPTPAAG